MKFILEAALPTSVRIGKLVVERDGKEIVLETPLCLAHTSKGFLPYLSPDLVQKLPFKANAALLSVSTMFEQPGSHVLSRFGKGIHKFLNLEENLLYLSLQDPAHPPPSSYNEEKSISIWDPSGRRKLSITAHMDLVESFRPDVLQPLCDTASSLENQTKRIKKSVNRTLRFLDWTLEMKAHSEALQHCDVLGVIEGSDCKEERLRSARETVNRPVDGFIFEGYQLPFDPACMKDILSSVEKLLPNEKPRFITGLHKPADVFTALECGIDVFDSSYASSATERGIALAYNIGSQVLERKEKIKRFVDQSLEDGLYEQEEELDLKDGKFSSDLCPLVDGCGCYTCQTFTRAYVHHLLVTKELLAGILLMIHNCSHVFSFFNNLRFSLKNSLYDDFVLLCLGREARRN